MKTGTTAVEYLKAREQITQRPAATRIRDAEHARDRAIAERDIAMRELATVREERDMVTRRLADLSSRHGDARIILTMALSALKEHREHATARTVYQRIRSYFDLRGDE